MKRAVVLLLLGCTSRVPVAEVDDDGQGSTGEPMDGSTDETGDEGPIPDPRPDLPGEEETSTTGTAGTDESSSSSSSTGDGVSVVSGTIRRVVEPAEGQDGIGDLHIAVVDHCSQSFDIVAVTSVYDGDSGVGIDYEIAGIPDGTWYVVAFLDDDDDADPRYPQPDRGDLVASDGFGVGCAEFTIEGGDATNVDLELNAVFMW